MVFSWFKNRRRRQLRSGSPPAGWAEIVQRNVRQVAHLPSDLRERLWRKVPVFVAEKNWTGCGGLTISDEIRVTIAAKACLMAVGSDDDYCFDGVQSILVYPGAYLHPDEIRQQTQFGDGPVFGESWHRGPIVLSWHHVLDAGGHRRAGQNLVVHEFAHHLDGLDGDVAGTPLLPGRGDYDNWYRVTEAEYFRLVGSTQRGEASLLDGYGASSRAEFFAVASECFFELPGAMSHRHAELYDALRTFYRLDPAGWWPDAVRGAPKRRSCKARKKPGRQQTSKPPEQPNTPALPGGRNGDPPATGAATDKDHEFSCGVLHINHERFSAAADAFGRVLVADSEDAEAYWHRALALLNLERLDEALADCGRALELEPGDAEALRIRGFVHLARGQYAQALEDLNQAVADISGDAEAYYQRGRARAGLGHWRRAIKDYSRAIRLDPYDAEIYYARGLAYSELGNDRKTAEDLEKAEQLDPAVFAQPEGQIH